MIVYELELIRHCPFSDSAVHLTGNYVPDLEEAEDDMDIPPELAALAARMRAGEEIDDMEYVVSSDYQSV